MFIIKNGTIHVGNGQILKNHDILINNGIIEKVEQNINCDNAEVIDATGQEIFPGFIDPVSSIGCMDITFSIQDQDETSNPITPDAKIKYSFNHSEVMLEELYKVGITTIGAAPGNTNVIGGQMAAYKTWGLNSNKMLIKEPVGLKGSVISLVKETYGKRDVAPKTKMGIFDALKNTLDEVKRSMEAGEDCETDDKKSIIKKVLNREIPLFITANKGSEIEALINVIKEYNINLIICGAYQSDRCMKSIKEANASIIIGEQVLLTAKNYNNTDLYKISQEQKDSGLLSITLTGDSGPVGKVKYLWNAIEFYKSGVDSEEVLKMMTINPAKMLGVNDRLGTIEEGKEADIVIYTNNPIEYYNSRVSHTIIGGKMAYREGGNSGCC